MHERYTELDEQRQAAGDKKSCGVIAVAVLLGTDFLDAQEALEGYGRKPNKSTLTKQVLDLLRDRGFETDVWRKGYAEQKTLRSLMRTALPKYDLLVHTAKHFTVIRGGEAHDWAGDSLKRVKVVYRVKKTKGRGIFENLRRPTTATPFS